MAKKIPNANKYAQAKGDVLIAGENGVGKRYYARQIHASRNKKGDLVMIDGLATPEEEAHRMLESVKANSTLVVANIDVASPIVKSGLLDFLKQRPAAGVKVIVTTTDLGDLDVIQEKMAGLETIEIPPLRERREDLRALADSITSTACKLLGKKPLQIEAETISTLELSSWPENIRGLHRILSKGVLISHGDTLQLPLEFLDEHQHLQDAIGNIQAGRIFVLDQTLYLVEKLLIQRTLKTYQHNQSRSAQIMGLSEANFRYRLKKFGLPSIREVR